MSHNHHGMHHHDHEVSTTASPHEGHNMGGHDMSGHDMGGHDMSGHDMSGHDMGGHDMSGHDMGGHDMSGHEGHHDMGGMNHSGNMGGMSHMMSMSFHYGTKETVLFDSWSFSTANGLIASVLGIFLLGVLYEGLKYYREYLYWKHYNSVQYGGPCHKLNPTDCNPEDQGNEEDAKKQKRFGIVHLYQTFLHFVQVNISYCLMLIFMTYNVYLAIAVALGSAVGFFLFGWRRAIPVDLSERSDYPLRIKEVDNTEQNAPFQNPA